MSKVNPLYFMCIVVFSFCCLFFFSMSTKRPFAYFQTTKKPPDINQWVNYCKTKDQKTFHISFLFLSFLFCAHHIFKRLNILIGIAFWLDFWRLAYKVYFLLWLEVAEKVFRLLLLYCVALMLALNLFSFWMQSNAMSQHV